MNRPFAASQRAVPVWVVKRSQTRSIPPGTALLRLPPAQHDHAAGDLCPGCAARGDIRLALFDLLTAMRQGQAAPFTRVIVEARDDAELARIVASLTPGLLPVSALRDHTVARSFRLAGSL